MRNIFGNLSQNHWDRQFPSWRIQVGIAHFRAYEHIEPLLSWSKCHISKLESAQDIAPDNAWGKLDSILQHSANVSSASRRPSMYANFVYWLTLYRVHVNVCHNRWTLIDFGQVHVNVCPQQVHWLTLDRLTWMCVHNRSHLTKVIQIREQWQFRIIFFYCWGWLQQNISDSDRIVGVGYCWVGYCWVGYCWGWLLLGLVTAKYFWLW
jgi:hypothetical protein